MRHAMLLLLAFQLERSNALLEQSIGVMRILNGNLAVESVSEKEILLTFLKMWHPSGVVSRLASGK